MYVGLSDLAREQGDLQAATRHLRASKDLGEHMGYPQNRYRLHVVTARIRQAEGDLDGALDAIHEAQRLYMPDFIPDVRPLPAQEARILLRQGRWPKRMRGSGARPVASRRPDVSARVRARHACEGAPRPIHAGPFGRVCP